VVQPRLAGMGPRVRGAIEVFDLKAREPTGSSARGGWR